MDSRKILVAVDGSDNAMDAVRYVGGIVGAEPGFRVQLLYIETLPERDLYPDEAAWREACVKEEHDMRAFLVACRDLLVETGLDAERISERYIGSCRSPLPREDEVCFSPGESVTKGILDVQRDGGFGTVALGRRGLTKAEEFLCGSVSNRIIREARGCAVWIVE